MASSARNPKDLRQIVSASQQDMTDMQTKLSKLRYLAEDEKTENALLRSRIDEQSELIMIQKQRADDTANKMRTLERINTEMEQFREEANDKLNMEIRKFNILDARFNDLANNHSQLIKIKDDYKRQNQALKSENARLKEDNANLFSKEILERDKHIEELDKSLMEYKTHSLQLEKKNRSLDTALKEVEQKYKEEFKQLRSILADTQERLKASQHQVLQQSQQQQSFDRDAREALIKVTKEKDDMLSLAMQRGKVIQDKVTDNKKLQQKVDEMEKSLREMHIKFEREAAAVNCNLAVRQLRMDMTEAETRCKQVTKDYEAFKKHTQELLTKERDLNAKLRHLVG